MRVYVGSLGCKLNQSEMDDLARQLAQAGHSVVASPQHADVCVLNTCAVTHVAAQKSRQALRHLHRANPDAHLIATGCYAELAPAELCELPGVESVVGNAGKHQLAQWLTRQVPSPCPGDAPLPPRTHTRALVKIQDGCDNTCTYCVIHVARGPQASRRVDEILAQVRDRLDAGHQEIVLTGVHIGAYGRDEGGPRDGPDLWGLVSRILGETGVRRLRLSSIEPWDLPESAFGLWQAPRLCRHLHLPLQSGCEATLRRMARRYSPGQFESLVQAARAAIPDLAVTTDVIVGFPGETDREFAQSLEVVRAMQFARVHVFPYSPRPGTPAASMPLQVPPGAREQRARAMRAAGAAGGLAFRRQFVGRVLDVLWETARDGPGGRVWSGLTGNYLRVHAESGADLSNALVPTRLLEVDGEGLRGQIET